MKQLTVRGFDEELSDCIRHEAEHEGISLSKAALRLLRKGAGLPSKAIEKHTGDNPLDNVIGSMSAEDAQAIRDTIAFFHKVDEEKWG